ncbi:MAG: RdgB/HAM1 family non-canonical purine NTP pyrophosphatase [bacterium]
MDDAKGQAAGRRLLVATRNRGKARELAAMLGEGWRVETLADFPQIPEVAEDGATFEGNARKKALEVSAFYEGWVLADDSGLEVDFLGGKPGVFSARYAGEPADDARNTEKLLSELKNVSREKRGAQYRCVLVLAERGKVLARAEGVCRGAIANAPEGSGGFGYDPVFVPEGYHQTFGELAAEIKGQISHRSQAMRELFQIHKIS